MSIENTPYKKKSKSPYFASIFFFVFTIFATLGLWFYNEKLIDNIAQIDAKMSQIETNMNELSQDSSLEIFSLLQANKKMIDTMRTRSKVSTYMKHLKSIGSLYDLELRGFEFSWSHITTNAFIRSDDNGIAYQKLVKFIQNYRENENALFELWFIPRVLWYDDMKLNLNFKIKDS